ncbi:hypothetical protein GCM10010216_21170 [Streptomyces flaveolus]|nr:hypothetical protein GCM10010216_21170 [Streptomyces flaveolus]
MAKPAQNAADLSGEQSGDSDSPTSPASAEAPSTGPPEAHAHEPAVLPGAVAMVWSSILSTAYRRLGKRQ